MTDVILAPTWFRCRSCVQPGTSAFTRVLPGASWPVPCHCGRTDWEQCDQPTNARVCPYCGRAYFSHFGTCPWCEDV